MGKLVCVWGMPVAHHCAPADLDNRAAYAHRRRNAEGQLIGRGSDQTRTERPCANAKAPRFGGALPTARSVLSRLLYGCSCGVLSVGRWWEPDPARADAIREPGRRGERPSGAQALWGGVAAAPPPHVTGTSGGGGTRAVPIGALGKLSGTGR